MGSAHDHICRIQIVPEIDTDLLMIVFLSEAMKSDLIGGAMSLNEPVERFKTIEDKFSPISYSKGMNNIVDKICFKLSLLFFKNRWRDFPNG